MQQWPHCAGAGSCSRVFRLPVGLFCGFTDGKNVSKTDFNRVAISNTGARLSNSEMTCSSAKKHTYMMTYMHTLNDMYTLLPSPNQFCFQQKNQTHLQRNCNKISKTRYLQIALLVPNKKHTHFNKINLSHPHLGKLQRFIPPHFFLKPFLVGG